jgi:four helix bundle protein
MARGSVYELITQLEIALNLCFTSVASHADLDSKVCEVERMLASMVRKIEQAGDTSEGRPNNTSNRHT